MNRSDRRVILNKSKFLKVLNELEKIEDLRLLKTKLQELESNFISIDEDKLGILNMDTNGDTVELNYTYLMDEIEQIEKVLTLKRGRYYLKRLERAITKIKTNEINDINLNRWKEYDEIITDSLWILNKRDTSGAHLSWYWGNFIPQIPHQMMLRYTKRGDWILDTFVGSGTTLIECRRLGRNGLGIELNPEVVQKARNLIEKEPNKYGVITDIITGDSRKVDIEKVLNKYGIKRIQLIIMHPPYHDIIKFSEDTNDLSNAEDIEDFLKMFGEVIDKATPYLEKDRYLVLVIGDKYSKGEWIPLGFYCMQEVLRRKYSLKSIIVKNFEETRGKRNQKELWRYRALAGGFYVFKHEYIMLFKKR